jgi:hypothetical protein
VLNRLRGRSDALDEAIYSTNFDPKAVELRAADLAATQAEITKLQAPNDGVRQILTSSRRRVQRVIDQGAGHAEPPGNRSQAREQHLRLNHSLVLFAASPIWQAAPADSCSGAQFRNELECQSW